MLLDVPGADPETLDVALDRQELRVSARSTPSVPQGYTLVHAEYREGNYERVFTVSDRSVAPTIRPRSRRAATRSGRRSRRRPRTTAARSCRSDSRGSVAGSR